MKPDCVVIGWRPSSLSGWGVYGLNLAVQLKALGRNPILYLAPHMLDVSPEIDEILKPVLQRQVQLGELLDKIGFLEFDFPVLHALRNDFEPPLQQQSAVGTKNIGVIFFEDTEFSTEGLARAEAYDLIVTGSSWNKEILELRGLTNVTNVFQGIDDSIFYPRPKIDRYPDRFVIYSGGKLEYRKGQDVVIAAFREFHARHPEALLIFAWGNQWPGIMPTIANSPFVKGAPEVTGDNNILIDEWLMENGVPEEAFINLGMPPNKDIPGHLAAADAAVFPNRCESGTNLVAMEAMACGLPSIIAANTGQLDLIVQGNYYPLEQQSPVAAYPPYKGVEGWREPSVEETLDRLEEIYQNREEAIGRGKAAAIYMTNFTWSRQISSLLGQIDGLFVS